MSFGDLYSILGVLPDAEDIVITAAYRALAQRYHPDRWIGDPAIAHRRMSAINAAYKILGDKRLRADYDSSRSKTSQAEYSTDEQAEQSEAFSSALGEIEDRWQVASSIYPDLEDLRKSLKQVSTSLAFAFVTALLDSKAFAQREELADSLEETFLQRYFGTNESILEFARELISYEKRDAAKALNRLVDVMGSNVEPYLLISRIEDDFDIRNVRELHATEELRKARLNTLVERIRAGYYEPARLLATILGYKIEQVGWGILSAPKIHLTCPDKSPLKFENSVAFIEWAQKELCKRY